MQEYPIRRRASATANHIPPHRAGHSFNHHPEDVPYLTDQRKKYPNPLDLAESLDYPGEPGRMPTSVVRYVDTRGNPVIQRGNQRFVLHDEPPPRHRRRPHWTVIAILSGVVVLGVFALVVWAAHTWNDTLNDWTYTKEFRTFSIDYAVGHNGDSLAHPSHFIVQNNHRNIVIIEFPKDDPGKVIVYYGPSLFGDGQEKTPVTLSFQIDTQTGRIDMVLHVEGQAYIFANNGQKFLPPVGQ